MIRVYVAGRSRGDFERCAEIIARVHAHPNLEITVDWVAAMRNEPKADHELSPSESRHYADADFQGVATADVFWLLDGAPGGAGRWFELGAAYALSKRIIVSGAKRSSIFCYLAGHYFENDDAAWEFLRRSNMSSRAHKRTSILVPERPQEPRAPKPDSD